MIAELALLLLVADGPHLAVSEAPASTAEEGSAQEQALYAKGTAALDRREWLTAEQAFAQLAAMKGARADAALYWRAYALNKDGHRDDALQAIAALRSAYPASRWVKDAGALELEIRQASGQPPAVSDGTSDDLKLMALGGLMTADPARALPIITQMLSGASSEQVKDRALFVLAQSGAPEARTTLLRMARNDADPALQAKAVHYLGLFGGADSKQALVDLYAGSKNLETRRAVVRALMLSGDRARLAEIARTETSPELRREAIAQLGVVGARAELAEIYKQDSTADGKRAVIKALFVSGAIDQMTALATSEPDPAVRTEAIQCLGLMGTKTAPTLKTLYAGARSPDVKRAVVHALFVQGNAAALVEIARQETDPALKRDAVRMLSLMQSKEATDYMLELLK